MVFFERRHRGVENVAVERIGCGVVHQNIDAAVLGVDVLEGALNLGQIANVATQRFGLTTGGDDRVGHGLTAFHLAAGHEHGRAILGQTFGDGFADTPAGAGHQRNAAVEIEMIA